MLRCGPKTMHRTAGARSNAHVQLQLINTKSEHEAPATRGLSPTAKVRAAGDSDVSDRLGIDENTRWL